MKSGKWLNLLVLVPLLLGTSSVAAAATPSHAPVVVAPQAALDKVEALVLEELSFAGQTDFFIWMAQKADLSPAYALRTKAEKGQFVFDTLRATAERTQRAVRAYLDARTVEYEPFYIANKILVRGGTEALLAEIVVQADVARITANHKFQLQEPLREAALAPKTEAIEPNLSFINADDVWAVGIDGSGTVVAGNDTGLDETHPAIARHYRGCLNPPTCTSWDHNYNWWDATGTYPADPSDGHGHGTHTTGTMVGDDGGTNQIGVAPGAQTVHCKNMTDGGSGNDRTFTECFEWDLAPWDLTGQNPDPDRAPDAVNNSWGYAGGNAPLFEDEIAALQAAGIAVVASAGNEGPGCASLRSPGDYSQVLTIGSVNHAGGVLPGSLSGFSSRGPSDLYPSHTAIPDIVAPGENIRSSVPGGYQGGWSGTSMAGPHATALIGLIWSANPALRGQISTTYQIIYDTAVRLVGQPGSSCGGNYVDGPNNDWGYGTIDAYQAVLQAIVVGGAGTLQGTVVDVDTSLPIEGVKVTAVHGDGFTWSDHTDASGFYQMTVAPGTFEVTASHQQYLSSTVTGIEVVLDGTGVQDFALQAAAVCSPTPLEVRVPLGGTHTEPATIYNRLLTDYAFAFRERDAGYLPTVGSVQISRLAPAGPAYAADGTAIAAGAYGARPERSVTLQSRSRIQNGPKVVLLNADDDSSSGSPIQGFLQAYGDLGLVELMDARYATPTLSQLQAYDVVVTWSNYAYANPVGIGDVLADYVDEGGKVINLLFSMGSHGWRMEGRFMSESYTALNGGNVYYSTSCLGAHDAGHPILAGITAVCDFYRLASTYLTAGAYEIARWQDNELFVAAKEDQTVVSIAGYVGFSYQWTGQMADLLHNAILWLAPPDVPWFSQQPITGTVPAQASLGVSTFFTATTDVGVTQPGIYFLTLNVSGDPSLNVPVTMTVDPPADWGKLEGTVTGLGYCDSDPAPLAEAAVVLEGSSGVTWTLLTDENGYYQRWVEEAESPLGVTVTHPGHQSGEAAEIIVTGGHTTTLDFDLRWLAPCLDVAPARLEFWVPTGLQAAAVLSITNDGAQPLDFSLFEISRTIGVLDIEWLQQSPVRHGEETKGLADETGGGIWPQDSGGPDPFGYTYLDSDEPAGPSFDWIEISATGQDLGLGDDDHIFPVSLPFAFNFYGVSYAEVAVGSNGVVYFVDTYVGQGNACLPVDGGYGVRDLVAGYWDDLNPSAGGAVYYQEVTYNGQDLAVIEWYQVPHFGGSDLLTFEIILFSNGSILLQYLDASSEQGSGGTTGIQGGWVDPSYYLEYSCNTAALADSLAICFTYPGSLGCAFGEDVPWVWEDPISGTVPGLATMPVDVTVTSVLGDPLPLGTYTATLLLSNNDPVAGTPEVPVVMHVVEPQAMPTLSGDTYGCSLPGTTVTHTFVLTNEGPSTGSFAISVEFAEWSATPSLTTIGPLGAGSNQDFGVYVEIPMLATVLDSDLFTVTASFEGGIPGLEDVANGVTCAEVMPGVEVAPDRAASGHAGDVVQYSLSVTNLGDYTDSFDLAALGALWPTTLSLPNTGDLAPGDSVPVSVLVAIPAGAMVGDSDVVSIVATSTSDSAVTGSASVTTTVEPRLIYLPLVSKNVTP